MAKLTIAKRKVDEEAGRIAFDFTEHGEIGPDSNVLSTIVVALGDLPDDIVHKLALHGLSQKIGDTWSRNSEAAPDDAGRVRWSHEQATAMVAMLVEGNWAAARAAGERQSPELVLALQRYMAAAGNDKELSECQAVIDSIGVDDEGNVDKDARKVALSELRKELAVQIAEIRAERAKAKAESAETNILGGLFAGN